MHRIILSYKIEPSACNICAFHLVFSSNTSKATELVFKRGREVEFHLKFKITWVQDLMGSYFNVLKIHMVLLLLLLFFSSVNSSPSPMDSTAGVLKNPPETTRQKWGSLIPLEGWGRFHSTGHGWALRFPSNKQEMGMRGFDVSSSQATAC